MILLLLLFLPLLAPFHVIETVGTLFDKKDREEKKKKSCRRIEIEAPLAVGRGAQEKPILASQWKPHTRNENRMKQ